MTRLVRGDLDRSAQEPSGSSSRSRGASRSLIDGRRECLCELLRREEVRDRCCKGGRADERAGMVGLTAVVLPSVPVRPEVARKDDEVELLLATPSARVVPPIVLVADRVERSDDPRAESFGRDREDLRAGMDGAAGGVEDFPERERMELDVEVEDESGVSAWFAERAVPQSTSSIN